MPSRHPFLILRGWGDRWGISQINEMVGDAGFEPALENWAAVTPPGPPMSPSN